MAEVATNSIIVAYNSLIGSLPVYFQTFINLILVALFVVIYSVFVWKLYRFIATKNLLGLNLNRYNKSEHPFFAKILAGLLYFLEYIIVLPFLIFFWFSAFTLFLIFLTEGLTVQNILFISAIIITAIRMVSYYSEDLSKDLAKLLPFTLLAISITKPSFFEFTRILEHFNKIPELLSSILIYLSVIIIIEVVLRFFDFVISLFKLKSVPELPN
jgi:hypothetical protein